MVAVAKSATPEYRFALQPPCLRQQQVIDAWGYVCWTYVRVC